MPDSESPMFSSFFATGRRLSLPDGLLDPRFGKFAVLLEPFEFRYGIEAGPRVWLFEWQVLMLVPGELIDGFENAVEAHLAWAFNVGLDVLTQRHNLTKEQAFSYRAMWMLFEARKQLREYIGLRRLSWGDLMKSQFAKAGDEDPSLVPDVSREDLDDFWKKGAESAGVSPDSYSPQILPCALYEQVKNGSASGEAVAETWQSVMSSIMGARQPKGREEDDPISCDELGPALEHPFVPRLLAWLDKHNEDDLGAYWEHLAKQVSDSFKDVAGQKKDPVRKDPWPNEGLDKDDCRKAFVALVLYSYYYVAQCHEAFCEMLRESIQPPLSADETILFERMHMPRSALANLPAALLVERLPLLRPALMDLWTLAATADDATIAARLPALLRTYAQLVSAKRSADRMRHRRANPRLQSLSNEEANVAPAMERAIAVTDDAAEVNELYESLRNKAKPTTPCPKCAAVAWRFQGDDLSDPDRDTDYLRLAYNCKCGCHTIVVTLDCERSSALLASEDDF